MKPTPTAAQTRDGAVPVGVPEPGLVLGEVVHILRDDGAAVEAAPTRLDQADFGGRRSCTGSHSPEHTLDRRDVQLFGRDPLRCPARWL